MPRLITPMMASLRRGLPHDDDRYGWEFKWDGVRAIANVSGRQGRSATYGWGPGAAAAAGWGRAVPCFQSRAEKSESSPDVLWSIALPG